VKRVLVVDDEQPVVDHIVRVIERDLSSGFTVAGTASSGRQALEHLALRPDIVIMDVRMPGLSGLDTIREFQKRGASAVYILATAYERFDIAREALELGIAGYLLKPVVPEALHRALRTAASQFDHRVEMDLKEFVYREKDRQVRGFVAEAFVANLMLGQSTGSGVRALQAWLGIDKPYGLVGVASFLHNADDARTRLEAALQYKSPGFCGPLVADRCLIFLPLGTMDEATDAQAGVFEALESSLGDELRRGGVRVAFADPRPLEALDQSWPEAQARLSGRFRVPIPGKFGAGGEFLEEEEFHDALVQGDADRVRFAFETLLSPFESRTALTVPDRYRIIALLGGAIGRLVGLGRLDEGEAHRWMDFDDLRQAGEGQEFCLMARSRLAVITGAVGRSTRWSGWLAAALHYLRKNYQTAVTLDSVAEAVGVSPKRLSRLFITELGQAFSNYLIDLRIEKAKALLALPGASIKQVSIECGYPDPNYFARLFKKVTGRTPTEFSSRR